MSNLPQTLHSISFERQGLIHSPKLFVHKKWMDGNGIEHDERYPIDPESAILMEFCWMNQRGETVPERIVWEV